MLCRVIFSNIGSPETAGNANNPVGPGKGPDPVPAQDVTPPQIAVVSMYPAQITEAGTQNIEFVLKIQDLA